jgi:hypothetical protein
MTEYRDDSGSNPPFESESTVRTFTVQSRDLKFFPIARRSRLSTLPNKRSMSRTKSPFEGGTNPPPRFGSHFNRLTL